MLARPAAPAPPAAWLLSVLAAAVAVAAASARADAIDPSPIPACEPGFVVVIDHGGTRCARPSCATTSDCPIGLGCTPRRCVGRPTGCDAKSPPTQCDELEDRGPCGEGGTCPAGESCARGTCLPPEELSAYYGEAPFEVAGDEPDAGTPTPAPPVVRSGGGCCGSRGARAAGSWLLAPLALGIALAARRGRQPGR
jgi:hypothetical protein